MLAIGVAAVAPGVYVLGRRDLTGA
jgi:hypothetical protein